MESVQTRLPSDEFAEAIDKICKLEEDSAPERLTENDDG
jgi:hypothetical protein